MQAALSFEIHNVMTVNISLETYLNYKSPNLLNINTLYKMFESYMTEFSGRYCDVTKGFTTTH